MTRFLRRTGRIYDIAATCWAHDDDDSQLQADYRFSIASK